MTVYPLTSHIEPSIRPVAAPVEAAIHAITVLIEMLVDAIAFAIETTREIVVSRGLRLLRTAVQSPVDAVPLNVAPCLVAVAAMV